RAVSCCHQSSRHGVRNLYLEKPPPVCLTTANRTEIISYARRASSGEQTNNPIHAARTRHRAERPPASGGDFGRSLGGGRALAAPCDRLRFEPRARAVAPGDQGIAGPPHTGAGVRPLVRLRLPDTALPDPGSRSDERSAAHSSAVLRGTGDL